jgi:hypothetical protein
MRLHLPLERHREIGAGLKVVRQQLFDLHLELARSYRMSSPQARVVEKLVGQLGKVRCVLDGMCAKEHPAAFSATIYYGSESGT